MHNNFSAFLRKMLLLFHIHNGEVLVCGGELFKKQACASDVQHTRADDLRVDAILWRLFRIYWNDLEVLSPVGSKFFKSQKHWVYKYTQCF